MIGTTVCVNSPLASGVPTDRPGDVPEPLDLPPITIVSRVAIKLSRRYPSVKANRGELCPCSYQDDSGKSFLGKLNLSTRAEVFGLADSESLHVNWRPGSAKAHIATHPQIHYTFGVEYPFPPVGIVGAADGKNRRAFFFSRARFFFVS